MNNKKRIDWIVLLVGFIFLSAAIYRVFNYNAGVNEFNFLKIPLLFLPFIILLEVVLGLCFILNKKVFYASIIAIVFLSTAIILAFVSNFWAIINSISELFIFEANPTDILLHLLYILLLYLILSKYRNS
jgi:uncharacterized membrane protein YphA (DoxX/SURF4 family)